MINNAKLMFNRAKFQINKKIVYVSLIDHQEIICKSEIQIHIFNNNVY